MAAPNVILGVRPESELERAILSDPALAAGLRWGKPRKGHPEGSVAAHVGDLLAKLDEAGEAGQSRSMLRFIALVHDSFKYQVRDFLPKAGENHHATRARRFAERFTADERLLSTIELHDRPYALWRRLRRTEKLDDSAFDEMMRKVPDPEFFRRFIELDGSTEGKNPEPVRWFREELRRRRLLERPRESA